MTEEEKAAIAQSAAEAQEDQAAQAALQERGLTVVQEEPQHQRGDMTVYRLMLMHSDTKRTYEGFGDDRRHALTAAGILASHDGL